MLLLRNAIVNMSADYSDEEILSKLLFDFAFIFGFNI